MYMKSVVALSVFTVSTLFGASSFAADPQQTQQTDPQQVQEPKKPHKHKRHHKHKHHHKHHHHKHHHKHGMTRYHDPDAHPFYHRGVDWSQNFLLGVDLGYGRQKIDFITRYVAPVIPLPLNNYNSYSSTVSNEGFFYGIVGGWQYRYKRYLMGVEGNLDFNADLKDPKSFAFSNTMSTNQLQDHPHSFIGRVLYERGAIFALTGRAGYFVTPGFLPYVRAGAQVSRDNATYTVAESVPGTFLFAPDYSSRKKNVYGIVAGIGAEFPTFIGSSTLRVEYDFTKTQSLIITDYTTPVQGTHKFRYPETNILKVSWIWNFM